MDAPLVLVTRKPLKRLGRPPATWPPIPIPAPETRPKFLVEAVKAGEVRCPRKWSTLAIEVCADLQTESTSRCIEERCHFCGAAPAFRSEVYRSKSALIPKPGPRSKLVLVAEQFARGEGDFAQRDE